MDYEREIRGALEGDGLVVPDAWVGYASQEFGGFADAAILVAAASATEQPRPLSFFARFHQPIPTRKPLTVSLRVDRRGRTFDVVAATLLDDDRQLAQFTVSFGRESESPLRSQAVVPMAPLGEAAPVWRMVEDAGLEPPLLMRRVGYRMATDDVRSPAAAGEDWHLRGQWPATVSRDLALRAGVALMPIDVFVAPAANRANGVDLRRPSPVVMPTLDLAAWFYAPESPTADADTESPAGWLRTRTSVPVSSAACAVGRTQLWSGDRFVAEGMSQVVLVPAPR